MTQHDFGQSADDAPKPALLTASAVERLLSAHALEPTKRLGQNFVADPNTIRRIVRLADVAHGHRVVEIGPGLGSLTLGLVEAGCEVVAIERDETLASLLHTSLAATGVRIVTADALTLDWKSVLGATVPWTLVANLPYNIAAVLILQLLESAPMIEKMVVMVQKEVGQRLAAAVGSKIYGIPSVKLSLSASARIVGSVPADVFIPKPRVESVLLEVRRKTDPVNSDLAAIVGELLACGFGQRRKMIRSTLGKRYGRSCLESAVVDDDLRPEALPVEVWIRLAEHVMAERC